MGCLFRLSLSLSLSIPPLRLCLSSSLPSPDDACVGYRWLCATGDIYTSACDLYIGTQCALCCLSGHEPRFMAEALLPQVCSCGVPQVNSRGVPGLPGILPFHAMAPVATW